MCKMVNSVDSVLSTLFPVININKGVCRLGIINILYKQKRDVSNMKRKIILAMVLLILTVSIWEPLNISAEDNNDEKLPERYDLRELGHVSGLRVQRGPLCILFAATAAIESNAMVKGYGEYDLAEFQIGYMASNIVGDENEAIADEGHIRESEVWYKIGLDVKNIFPVLMRGYGIVTEDKYPIFEIGDESPEVEVSYDGDLYLDGYFCASADDSDQIKKYIMKYGAAFVQVFVANWFHSDEFYNKETKSAYMPAKGGYIFDHAAVLIGWDDNYSKYNFSTVPPGDGAWIIKNTWGVEGEYDYSYISYYDQCFSNKSQVIVASTNNKRMYDRIYQYDGGIGPYNISGTTDVAMNFKAKANESLTGVRIKPMGSTTNPNYLKFDGTIATIKIYKGHFVGDNSNTSNPIYTTEAKIEDSGYQTIYFDDEVKIHKGDDYYVLVTFDNPVTYALDGELGGSRASANPGETYIKIDKEDSWFDAVKTYSGYPECNACIKVLAKTREVTWYGQIIEEVGIGGVIASAIGILAICTAVLTMVKRRRKSILNSNINDNLVV